MSNRTPDNLSNHSFHRAVKPACSSAQEEQAVDARRALSKPSVRMHVATDLGSACSHEAPHRCMACGQMREFGAILRVTQRQSCCAAPAEQPSARIGTDGHVRTAYPRGPLGGEYRPFLDQTTGEPHWIEVLMACDGEGGQERPVPLELFLDAIHTAAFIGVRLSTLYSWASYLESTDRRGSRLIFYVDDLVNKDLPELENRLPKRRDVRAERMLRSAGGEWLRPGRHARTCRRDHEGGKCAERRPRPHARKRRDC